MAAGPGPGGESRAGERLEGAGERDRWGWRGPHAYTRHGAPRGSWAEPGGWQGRVRSGPAPPQTLTHLPSQLDLRPRLSGCQDLQPLGRPYGGLLPVDNLRGSHRGHRHGLHHPPGRGGPEGRGGAEREAHHELSRRPAGPHPVTGPPTPCLGMPAPCRPGGAGSTGPAHICQRAGRGCS